MQSNFDDPEDHPNYSRLYEMALGDLRGGGIEDLKAERLARNIARKWIQELPLSEAELNSLTGLDAFNDDE